jgi:hypothetical protein
MKYKQDSERGAEIFSTRLSIASQKLEINNISYLKNINVSTSLILITFSLCRVESLKGAFY